MTDNRFRSLVMTFSPNRESCPHLISIFSMVTLNSVDIGQALTLVYRFSRFIVRSWGSSMMTSRFHKNWTHLPEIRKATLGISCCCNIKVDQCDPEILLRKATKRGITSYPRTWQPKPPQVEGLHHRRPFRFFLGLIVDRYSIENIMISRKIGIFLASNVGAFAQRLWRQKVGASITPSLS